MHVQIHTERVEELVAALTNHHIYTSQEPHGADEPTAENQSIMDRDYPQMTEMTHRTAQRHKTNALSYLSCQVRVSQAASSVVFKIFHLHSHSTEQERGE